MDKNRWWCWNRKLFYNLSFLYQILYIDYFCAVFAHTQIIKAFQHTCIMNIHVYVYMFRCRSINCSHHAFYIFLFFFYSETFWHTFRRNNNRQYYGCNQNLLWRQWNKLDWQLDLVWQEEREESHVGGVSHSVPGLYSWALSCARKPVFGVSDQVRHKRGCTATEDC